MQTLPAGLFRSGRRWFCTFLTKEDLRASFPHIYNFSQSKKLSVTLSAFWGIFVPRQKNYQIQAGENRVNKDHSVTMQIYIELPWGNTWQRIEKEWNFARAGEERSGFQRINLTKSAEGNSINAAYCFVLFSWAVYSLILLRNWMFTI